MAKISGKPKLPISNSDLKKAIVERNNSLEKRNKILTGAIKDTEGAISKAEGGTLFLDEIGELKPDIQVKLLQFLQYKTYQPIGGKDMRADVRIIAATNKDLDSMVRDGEFREDLFYRLNVVRFHLPPLRDRRDDTYVLAHHFLNEYNSKYKKRVRLSSKCYDRLKLYDWPGNVRELKHYIERVVVLSSAEEVIEDLELSSSRKKHERAAENIIDYDWPTLSELEKRYIGKVLCFTNGNKLEAATILGIDPSTLWRKLKRTK